MRSGSCRLASQGRLGQVGGSRDPSAQVWAQDALRVGRLQLAGSGSHVNSCRRTERDLSHVHPPPPMRAPVGPGFSGQSMPSFREACSRRGPDFPPFA